jgi:hypothetical protein
MHYSRGKLIMAVTTMMIALTGCGKSVDAKREEIVKCAGFWDIAFAKAGITSDYRIPIRSAAQQYAAAMDPARVARLVQEGETLATELMRNNDPRGTGSFLGGCLSTYKALGD